MLWKLHGFVQILIYIYSPRAVVFFWGKNNFTYVVLKINGCLILKKNPYAWLMAC